MTRTKCPNKKLNEEKTIIDISHCGEKTSLSIIEHSDYPVLCGHSFCKSIYDHPRGKSDKVLEELAKNEGLFGILLNPSLISNNKKVTLEDFFVHLEYTIELIGEDYISIGTDWDVEIPRNLAFFFNEHDYGGYLDWSKKIEDYTGMQDWPKLVSYIKNKGFSKSLVDKIAGKNFLRFYKKVKEE